MTDKLMSVKIEIDPLLITASLGTAHNIEIKVSRFGKVMDLYSQMKGSHKKNGKENFDFIIADQFRTKSKYFLPPKQQLRIVTT